MRLLTILLPLLSTASRSNMRDDMSEEHPPDPVAAVSAAVEAITEYTEYMTKQSEPIVHDIAERGYHLATELSQSAHNAFEQGQGELDKRYKTTEVRPTGDCYKGRSGSPYISTDIWGLWNSVTLSLPSAEEHVKILTGPSVYALKQTEPYRMKCVKMKNSVTFTDYKCTTSIHPYGVTCYQILTPSKVPAAIESTVDMTYPLLFIAGVVMYLLSTLTLVHGFLRGLAGAAVGSFLLLPLVVLKFLRILGVIGSMGSLLTLLIYAYSYDVVGWSRTFFKGMDTSAIAQSFAFRAHILLGGILGFLYASCGRFTKSQKLAWSTSLRALSLLLLLFSNRVWMYGVGLCIVGLAPQLVWETVMLPLSVIYSLIWASSSSSSSDDDPGYLPLPLRATSPSPSFTKSSSNMAIKSAAGGNSVVNSAVGVAKDVTDQYTRDHPGGPIYPKNKGWSSDDDDDNGNHRRWGDSSEAHNRRPHPTPAPKPKVTPRKPRGWNPHEGGLVQKEMISMEDYEEEGKRETAKALAELRTQMLSMSTAQLSQKLTLSDQLQSFLLGKENEFEDDEPFDHLHSGPGHMYPAIIPPEAVGDEWRETLHNMNSSPVPNASVSSFAFHSNSNSNSNSNSGSGNVSSRFAAPPSNTSFSSPSPRRSASRTDVDRGWPSPAYESSNVFMRG